MHKNREARAARKERAAGRVAQTQKLTDEDLGITKPRRVHPVLIAFIIAVIVVAVGSFGLKMAYEDAILPVDPGNEAEILVEIPAGAGTADIAAILAENGLIGNETFFQAHSRRKGYDGRYKMGEYALTQAMDADEIAAILIEGNVAATKSFTIPEGLTTAQIKDILIVGDIVTAAEFDSEVRDGVFDYAFLEDCPEGDLRLEGFLYPETYEVYADADAHEVINKMLSQFNTLFKPEYYDRAEEIGMSVTEVVAAASIIERETVTEEERKIIAGVINNRLEDGWKLEMCSTIQYLLGEPKEILLYEDLEIDSPYNTYKNDGLPPGPICSPRIASIEAVLYPDDNDYFFFVLSADLDGKHRFSASASEFEQNKAAYYAAVEAAERGE